jgi:oligopeptide transport system substrate-binding protein
MHRNVPARKRAMLSGVLAVLSLVALLLTACASNGTASTGNAAPDSQQVLHDVLVPGSNDIATMDPGLVQDLFSGVPINLVFPGLLTLDGKLNVTPWAASAMPTVSSDGLTYTFSVRSGLKFSDGEPIDANAFAYAMNRSLDPCTASPVAYYLFAIKDAATFNGETCNKDGSKSAAKGQTGATIQTLIGDSIVVRDPQTLVVTLQQPAAYFLEAMTYPTSYAVPQQLITTYGTKWTDHLVDNGGFGGSLFKVTKWDHNGTLVLQRNPSFWGTPSKLREVDFTIYKSVETQYNAYLAGQNDRGVPPSTQYAAAKGKPDFHETGALQIDYYAMNWKMPPFDDLRMRQAFSLAVNRQALANDVLHGTVIPSYHIVPAGMPGYDPKLNGPDGTQSLNGNPTLATQLEQAYVQQKCGGNAASCPPVTLTITSGSQDITNEAEAALQMWQKAFPGYPIKITTTDFNTLLNDLAARKVQFWAIAWIADYPDPQDWLSLQFSATAQYNDGNVNVPDANALMARADGEQDPVQRMKDYNAAEQMLVTQVAWMSLDQAKTFYEVRSYVKGYVIDAQGYVPLTAWQTMYIASH